MKIFLEIEVNGHDVNVADLERSVAESLADCGRFEIGSDGTPFRVELSQEPDHPVFGPSFVTTLSCRGESYSISCGDPESAAASASHICEKFMSPELYQQKTGRFHPSEEYKNLQSCVVMGAACLANILEKPHEVDSYIQGGSNAARMLEKSGEYHGQAGPFSMAADIYDGLDMLEDVDRVLKRGLELAEGESVGEFVLRMVGRLAERKLGSQLYSWLFLFGIVNANEGDRDSSIALAVLAHEHGISINELAPTVGKKLDDLPSVGAALARAAKGETTQQIQIAIWAGRRAIISLLGEVKFQLLLQGQDLPEIFQELRSSCMASAPVFADPMSRRLLLSETSSDNAEALRTYGRALKDGTASNYSRNRYATLSMQVGQWEPALQELEKVLAGEPDNLRALLLRGSILCDNKRDFPGALADFEKLLKLDPSEDSGWFCLANVHYHLGQMEKVVAAAGEAIRLFPAHHSRWFRRGQALLALGRYQEAAEDFQKAIDRGDRSVASPHHLVQSVRKSGDLIRAAEIVSKMPSHPFLQAQRGLILAESGDKKNAIHGFEAYLNTDEKCEFDDEIREVYEKLKKRGGWFRGLFGGR